MKINDNERKILERLIEDEECAYYFKSLTGDGMDIKAVRGACRSLARKGLAEYHRGLFNDDGMAAGSGYGITAEGMAFIQPCDLCPRRASFDYEMDATGKYKWTVGFDEKTSIRKRECDLHYKSIRAEQPAML